MKVSIVCAVKCLYLVILSPAEEHFSTGSQVKLLKHKLSKSLPDLCNPCGWHTFSEGPKSRHRHSFTVTCSPLLIHVGFESLFSMGLSLAESWYFIYCLTKTVSEIELLNDLHFLKHWICYVKYMPSAFLMNSYFLTRLMQQFSDIASFRCSFDCSHQHTSVSLDSWEA